jgi:hypothetical protein
MVALTLRAAKGSPLTHNEMDANLTALDGGIAAKQDALVSGTNIKTVGGVSLLGSGDITVSGSAAWGSITGTLSAQTDLQTALNGKATSAQGAKADTALQPAAIGVSVQGYTAVLAATTASYTTAEQSKLAGIASGATANSSDATLLARANHTGTQSVSTITGLGTLATQNGTFSGTSSGTNTGDQSSIVGITGTKAQFNTAVTDGDLQFVGDAPTAHTHVAANITDFDTAVAANSAVTANTAKVTNANHTGDATGATALTLATVNSNVGAFGSASTVATFTVNAKGLTTAAGSTAIQIAESQVTGLVADLALKAPIASPTFTGTVTLPAGQIVNGVTLTTAGGTTNFLRADGTYAAPTGGGSSAIAVQDEGVSITTALATLNFVGSGVTVTGGTTATVTIPSAGAVPVTTRIRRNANQSIPTGASWTDLSWDTSSYQTGGTFWSSGANTTIPEDGYYQVFVESTFDGTGLIATATTYMQVLLNGATVIGDDEKQLLINGKAAMFVMAQRFFTAGDTVKVQVKHSDTGSVSVIAQGDHSPDIIVTKLIGAKGDIGPQDFGMNAALSQNATLF